MKIGVCTSPDNMELAAELGYDYIEANFSWMIGLDDEAFEEMTASTLIRSPMPPPLRWTPPGIRRSPYMAI